MYRWDAEDYKKSSREQQKWARELIAKLNLRGSERVLDLGCGDGKVTAEIALNLKRGGVHGIDSSPEMIDLAKKTFSKEKYPNLSFELCDARELNFNEEFDVVFSNAALHWILDQKKVLNGIKRSLKPGGRCVIQMGGKGNAQDIIKILDSMLVAEPWKQYFQNFKFPYFFAADKEYTGLLHESGLDPVRVELIPKDMKHSGKEGLKSWLRTTWLPYTSRIPENLQKYFIDDLTSFYLEEHPPDGDGTVHVSMIRLEVEAEKKLDNTW